MESTLLEALSQRNYTSVSTPCGYTKMLDRMEEEERAGVEAAFTKVIEDTNSGRAKVYSFSWLSGILKDHGYAISSSTLSRHARGNCGCE